MGEMINAYNILVGKPDRRLCGKPKRRWKNNITMDLLAQDRDQWSSGCNTV
jgi:hypothetical protein